MDGLRKHQVSLRGSSAKEITRDALLEKVTQEREFRNYMRRATAASLFIQRVWRRYASTKKAAAHLREEWQEMLKCHPVPITRAWISDNLLKPFLFFIRISATRHQRFEDRDVDCMQICFKILLESINSSDPQRNFCTLATSTIEDRKTWTYQAKKLISLCLLILSECDYHSHQEKHQYIVLTSMAMQFVVSLTDPKTWKTFDDVTPPETHTAVKDLVSYMCSEKCHLYISIRRYLTRLDVPFSSTANHTEDRFLITASAITLALRPFSNMNMNENEDTLLHSQSAVEQYCVLLLTIPWFTQRLPAVLLPAIKHKTILSPCFRQILISKEGVLMSISKLNNVEVNSSHNKLPPVFWALANIICLATSVHNSSQDSGRFTQDLDFSSYIHVSIILAENLLTLLELEQVEWSQQESNMPSSSSSSSYTDLLKPICQQWHLMKLLTCDLPDVAYYYSLMLRIFTNLNPVVGSMPILNMLSFTPGFLPNLWSHLEKSFFPTSNADLSNSNNLQDSSDRDRLSKKKKKGVGKNGNTKWANVLNKITRKSSGDTDNTESVKNSDTQVILDDSSDIWDVEPFRKGPEGLTTDSSHLLHLFCAVYAHLLLVLDDIEFYEKQVPFTLQQQRRIASMVNTLVYNALSYNMTWHNHNHIRPLMDTSVRCLHLLYERDCRHQFCPHQLWLSPAKNNRPPIAVAARTHEVVTSNLRSDDSFAVSNIHSVITTTPHVFPFEERVEMFRELISMDKVSRRMAGEIIGPGPQAVEVVIRRSHIIEDGFQQLNSLGSKLKSAIHVSFVSECGLPEAGLDYGGLSKEFLTDIAKAAFTPDYGMFIQTSTSDRLLIPNSAARTMDNGIQMIEFIGRVVGKALYEGILLDYSFSHVFVQKLLGRYSFIDELSSLDPELYKNLMYVKHYDGDVKDLSLDFTVTEELPGKRHVVELKPGGKDVILTNDNKLQYIYAMADYKLNRQASDETMHLVLETLQAAVRAGHEAALSIEPVISPIILNMWALHVSDPFISIDALDVLEAIKNAPGCVHPLVSRVLPYVGPILNKPQQQPDGLVAGSLDLLTMLLKNAPTDVVKAIYEVCFDPVVRTVLQSDDHGEMQNATQCLAALVSGGKQELLTWGGDPGFTMRCLLDVASRLLDPDLESSGSLFVGNYILQLILHLSSQMAQHIRDLVAAVVRRMQSCQIAGLRSSLLLIFARLVHMSAPHVDQFINLLITIPAESHSNSLHYVMSEWTKQQGEIQGAYQIKVTTTALALLLSARHVELGNINVQGHLIKSTAGITTRSKSKSAPDQWTLMPLPAKILAVLADVLLEIQEQISEEDDQESDWEEVEAGDAETEKDLLFSAGTTSYTRPSNGYLDAMAKAFNEDDDDGCDDDLLSAADPLNEINLANYLTNFFREFSQGDRPLFDHLCQSLTQAQKKAVQMVVSR